jgi:hypothetical protein
MFKVNLKLDVALAVETTWEIVCRFSIAGPGEEQCVSYITCGMNTYSIRSVIAHAFMNINSVQYSMFPGAPDGLKFLSELLVGLGSARDTRSGLGVHPHSQQFAE